MGALRTLLACVLASAGCVSSDPAYNKPTEPPVVAIRAPEDGASTGGGESLELLGRVTDPDGLDDIETIEWRSNVDGVLATSEEAPLDEDGFTRFTTILSPGTHVLSLVAEDTDDLQALDTITMTVGP